MASRYWVGSGSANTWAATGNTNWSATSGGANNASVPGTGDDVYFDGNSGTGNSVIGANITVGSVTCTGYTGTITHNSSVTLTISSGGANTDFLLVSGMTYTLGSATTSALSFTATSGTTTITSGGQTFGNTTFNGVGGTWQVEDSMQLGSGSTITLTNGTFNANNTNITCGIFSSSNSNTRTLTMGSGTWTLTGNNASIWNTTTSTNLTTTGTSATIVANYSGSTGTRTFAGFSAFSHGPVFISAGSDTVNTGSSITVSNLDFTGFSGTWTGNNTTITGYLTLGTGMTSAGGDTLTFTSTSGSNNITTNGVIVNDAMTFNGSGGMWIINGNLNLGAHTLGLSQGTLNANNYNITASLFSSSNTNTRTLQMGSGTWTLTGTGTVWNTATTTNLTLTPGTSTVLISDASSTSKTFSGGGKTYYNLAFAGGNSSTYVLIGNNTFNNIAVNAYPSVVQFTASSTTTLTGPVKFSWNGNANELNVFESTSSGTAWTITSATTLNYDYISLQDSTGAGTGIPFYAGIHSTSVSNNTNWDFTDEVPIAQSSLHADHNPSLMLVSNANGITMLRAVANPKNGALIISNGSTGTNYSITNVPHDSNHVPAAFAVSGSTIVPIQADSDTNAMLVNST